MKPFERLDEAMNRRRLELRMNWREVAEAATVSYTALRAIRRGEYKPTELTARALDEALQWAHGSVASILAGGEPTPLEDAELHSALREEATAAAAESALSSRDIELVEELALSAAEKVGLSPDQAREAFRRALSRIERRRGVRAQQDDDPPTPGSRHAG